MNFQTFSTFRPKSACSDLTEIDTIQNISDWSPSNFHRKYQIDAREGAYDKNDGALQRCFGVIQDLRQRGGGGSSPPQSLAG